LTYIRIGESVFLLPDDHWEEWVRSGRIPADAWIRSPVWTKGVWRLADSLEVYHLFLPTVAPEARPRAPGLTDTVFSRRGLSTTELLIVLNLLVSGALLLLWKEQYQLHLWQYSRSLREVAGPGPGFFVVLIPMFLHASPGHLMFNMLSLVASGSLTEYFYGRWKVLGSYLVCGFVGAAFSLVLRTKPVLSVGASGAIFGLYGLALLFLLRHMRRFSRRQRWKTVRIYIPIMVLAVIPSIFGGDFYAHLGGFLAGCAIGVFLPPGPRIIYVTGNDETEEPQPC
jgi:membrane associated rhomboid family serine protease